MTRTQKAARAHHSPGSNNHPSPAANGINSPRNGRAVRPNQPNANGANIRANTRSHQSTTSPSVHTSSAVKSVFTAPAIASPQRLPPPMAMAPEARLTWNLKVLRRYDPLITRIFDQVPYAVLYTFHHAHAGDPDGGKGKKYEGHWEKSNIEGTVFIIERNEEPRYGFFILNRGGTSSVVQMFHQDDTIEVGADTKFLTFRPGLWDRATTPYTEPFTRCAKPSLICLWLSDEDAGPRFARFINRAKEHLAKAARHSSESIDSPPLTPLSQLNDISESESASEAGDSDLGAQSFKRQQAEFYQKAEQHNPAPADNAIERPLDKLFASLTQTPASASATAVSVQRDSKSQSTSRIETNNVTSRESVTVYGHNGLMPAFEPSATPLKDNGRGQALLQSLFGASAGTPQPQLPPPQSQTLPPAHSSNLLDQIFASAAQSALERTPQPNALRGGNLGAPVRYTQQQAKSPPTTIPHRTTSALPNRGQGPTISSGSRPDPVTPPPQRSRSRHLATAYDDGDDSDEVILISDKENRTNGATRSTTSSSTQPSHSAGDMDDVFQELEAPSPSLIPNPLHTPKPMLSRRQRAKAKSRAMQTLRESQEPPLGADAATRPAIREKGRGKDFRIKEQYIPHNVDTEPKVNSQAVNVALLEAYDSKRQDRGEVLSRYDFVSEVLTLIHKEPTFVDDLYARYERLTMDS